jgi:RNA polymerase sigma-70 factor (ECF subfamily)
MEQLSDEQLVQLCLTEPDKARDGFSVLMTRHQQLLARVLMGMLRNTAEVEDVIQEVFVRVFRKLASLREPARFKAWLLTIGRNIARNRLTRTKKTVPILPEDRVTTRTGDAEVEGDETKQRIWAALESLDDVYREPLTLFVEGMSPAEIAEAMDIKPETIRWRLHEARKKMKDILNDLDL